MKPVVWSIVLLCCASTCRAGSAVKRIKKDVATVAEEEDLKEPINDCNDILWVYPEATSGVYDISIPGSEQLQSVYCDMETDGGKWTVFQRRQDGSVDFYLGWEDYVEGFGDPNGEFWMGLETLYWILINSPQGYELRVDLESFEEEKRYAKYNTFYIEGAVDNYRLHVEEYSGDAGDSFTYHDSMPFQTKDKDKDTNSCASYFKGAWWYGFCYYSNLNGEYCPNGNDCTDQNVEWVQFSKSLKKTEMKIRRKL